MKFESTTIKDIAKILKLSPSTISRALKDSHQISKETKKKVLDLAESLNYRPNPFALGLKERKTKNIGIVVSEIANSFFSQAINGIESVAQEKGYNVVITQSKELLEREKLALQFLASRSVDGIIISVSTETSDYTHIQTLYEKGLPIVSFDRIVNFPNIHKVKLDNFEGTYKATKHLLNNGFKKISLLASAQHLSITEERIQGYIYALKEKKIKFNENLVKYCAHGGLIYEELESILKKILKDKNKPDAIISGSDKITTNLMRYCHKNNIKIPDSLGIIGFSNLDLTEFLTPSLSVITQPAFEMGKKACELLIKQIESKKTISVFEEIQLPTELLYRESTKKNKG